MSDDDQIQQQIAQLETIARQVMSRKAIERYNTLKVAHPQKAVQSLMVVAQFAQKNKKEVSDEDYKRILMMMENKQDFKIKR